MTPIEQKIRKLLELAGNNPSVNEAAAAFARAQALAAKYQIDLDVARLDDHDAPPPEQIDRATIDRSGRVSAWRYTLLDAIASVNRCEIFSSRDRSGCTLEAYGLPSDLATVAYLYAAISAEIERLASSHARGRGRSWGRSFRIGAAHEIGRRLREASEHAALEARTAAYASGGETALVRVDRALASSHDVADARKAYAREHLRLRNGGGFAAAGGGGYVAGRKAGKTVPLSAKRALTG